MGALRLDYLTKVIHVVIENHNAIQSKGSIFLPFLLYSFLSSVKARNKNSSLNYYLWDYLTFFLVEVLSVSKVLIAPIIWNVRNFETDGDTWEKREDIDQPDSGCFVDLFLVQIYRGLKKLEQSILLSLMVTVTVKGIKILPIQSPDILYFYHVSKSGNRIFFRFFFL